MKFSIKDFFSKCDQIRRKLRIWSHLLKKFLMENSFFVQWNLWECEIEFIWNILRQTRGFCSICYHQWSFSRYSKRRYRPTKIDQATNNLGTGQKNLEHLKWKIYSQRWKIPYNNRNNITRSLNILGLKQYIFCYCLLSNILAQLSKSHFQNKLIYS